MKDQIPDQQQPVEFYLHERYQVRTGKSARLQLYYFVRPLIPRSVQIALRRQYAKRQKKTAFPAWPIEPILVNRMWNELQQQIVVAPGGRMPLINFWPDKFRAAVALTHDVETAKGVANIPRVREVERKFGLVSSWNFVPERYPFDRRVLQDLKDEGCEIGVHGLYHDGKLFSTKRVFDERVPRINAYLREWGAVGFRSPATHRNPDWMPAIAAEYDSSFPDTDPFEPQAGGCCSIYPYFLGNLVELPITLPQDHTMFEILQQQSIDTWRMKSDWIMQNHGLVLIIIHPDYMIQDRSLKLYEEFLKYVTGEANLWHALPKDIAHWWRQRSQSTVNVDANGSAKIIGPAAGRGVIVWASTVNGSVKLDLK